MVELLEPRHLLMDSAKAKISIVGRDEVESNNSCQGFCIPTTSVEAPIIPEVGRDFNHQLYYYYILL